MRGYQAIIRGAYGEGNFGDDVLMLACHGLLSRVYAPERIAFVFVSHPPREERAYVERLLPGLNLLRFESEAAGAELVVWGGGTQFYSFPQTRTHTPFYRKVLAGLLDPRKACNFVVKKIFGGKFNSSQRFAALGVGIGPFVPGSAEESYTRDLFAKMDFVGVRDPDSMQLCRQWNVAHAALRSDLCFLPGAWWPQHIPAPAKRASRHVGIIVRDWPHDAGGAAYDQPSLRIARQLRAAGCDVSFILFRAHGDGGWARLLEENRETAVAWRPETQTIAEFLGILGAFDCLLTARYHGALFGALLGRTVVCIEVEPKLRLVAELLGVGLWRQPFDEAAGLALVEEALRAPERPRANAAAAVAAQRAEAECMMRDFLAFANAGETSPAPVTV